MNGAAWRRLALAIIWLAACTVQPDDPPASTPVPSLIAPTPTKWPRSTAEPSKPPTSTMIPSPQPTPTLALRLCSPLTLHPLDELPAIIGDPYNPPRPGREERHHGVDFGYYHYGERDSMLGEVVQSVLPGGVAAAINDLFPYGNMVIVETAQAELPTEMIVSLGISEGVSLYVLYAHLNQKPLVSLGEHVEACQPLGEVGMSGNTDIPHLHVETRLGPPGAKFESMRFYDTRATQEEMDNYVRWRTSGVFHHFDPMRLFSFSLVEAP